MTCVLCMEVVLLQIKMSFPGCVLVDKGAVGTGSGAEKCGKSRDCSTVPPSNVHSPTFSSPTTHRGTQLLRQHQAHISRSSGGPLARFTSSHLSKLKINDQTPNSISLRKISPQRSFAKSSTHVFGDPGIKNLHPLLRVRSRLLGGALGDSLLRTTVYLRDSVSPLLDMTPTYCKRLWANS